MASNEENQTDDRQEPKIPVFTVSKNGAILKNMFIVNKPPQPLSVSLGYEQSPDLNCEETLLVGRHPDCNIMLTHPSISRFHLQIYSNSVSQKFYVVDLSSVHGTWVSGKRLEARVRVEMKEGDTLRIGASSRAYMLSWVPLTRAYDMENPFVSELDMATAVEIQVEKDQQNVSSDEPNAWEMEIESLDSTLEGIDLLFSERHTTEQYVGEKIPSAPQIPGDDLAVFGKENMMKNNFAPECDNKINDTQKRFSGSLGFEVEFDSYVGGLNMEIEEKQFETSGQVLTVLPQSQYPEGCLVDSGIEMEEAEKEPYPKDGKTEDSSLPEQEESKVQHNEAAEQSPEDSLSSKLSPETSVNGNSCDEEKRSDFLTSLKITNSDSSTVGDLASEMLEEPNFGREIIENGDTKETMVLGSECFAKENSGPEIVEGIPEIEIVQVENRQIDIALRSLPDIETSQKGCEERNSSMSVHLSSESCAGERETLDDAVHSSSQVETPIRTSDDKRSDTLKSLSNLEGQSENEILEKSPTISSEKSYSLWSRRGKVVSAPQVQTCSSRIMNKGGKVSVEVEPRNKKSTVDKKITKDLFPSFLEEKEIFTPDKENFTPNTLQLRLLQKKTKLGEKKDLKPCKALSSLEVPCKAYANMEDMTMTTSSDKENQTPKVFKGRNSARTLAALKNGMERVPFQSLRVNSPSMSKSGTSVKNSSSNGVNSGDCAQVFDKATEPSKHYGKRNRTTWDMVVDTSSLLDRESRKSLQLLQGLRGTRLIIPRMVIRELDCMNRQGSLFRRTSEASLALEWIERCMVETNWWICVQSSAEDGSLIPPTPPATPLSQLSDMPSVTGTSATLSSCNIIQELVSPTAEDYILDYTLLCRKKNNHGQIALLSNDVTLKIKSMAEGLICETAEDFRGSLVNPFSNRFLWSESCCPRGQTWSYQDDVVLRERYYQLPLRKPSSKGGEAARGLKLILLHNSNYGQISQQ